MAVAGVDTYNATTPTSDVSNVVSKELDRNAFMKLLIAQLQYQDPLSPMKNEAYIAQLAQFSSLEQMQQMNANLQSLSGSLQVSSATGLLGHTVTALSEDATTTVSGVVTAITYVDGTPKLIVEGQLVTLDAIVAIQ